MQTSLLSLQLLLSPKKLVWAQLIQTFTKMILEDLSSDNEKDIFIINEEEGKEGVQLESDKTLDNISTCESDDKFAFSSHLV